MGLGRNSRACNKFKTKQAFHLRLRTLKRGIKKNEESQLRKNKARFNVQPRLRTLLDTRALVYTSAQVLKNILLINPEKNKITEFVNLMIKFRKDICKQR